MTHSKTLQRINEKIHKNEYALTSHAEDGMQDDQLTEVDVEQVILDGKIVRVQKDHLGRTKYTIEGETGHFRKVRVSVVWQILDAR